MIPLSIPPTSKTFNHSPVNYKYPKISEQSKKNMSLKLLSVFFKTKNKLLFRSLYIRFHGNRHLNLGGGVERINETNWSPGAAPTSRLANPPAVEGQKDLVATVR